MDYRFYHFSNSLSPIIFFLASFSSALIEVRGQVFWMTFTSIGDRLPLGSSWASRSTRVSVGETLVKIQRVTSEWDRTQPAQTGNLSSSSNEL